MKLFYLAFPFKLDMFKVSSFFTLLSTICLVGCTEQKLTPITEEGKNTFSCKVNGKTWIPDGKGDIFVSVKAITGGFLMNAITQKANIHIKSYTSGGDVLELYTRSSVSGLTSLDKTTKTRGENFDPENYGLYVSRDKKVYMTSEKAIGKIKLSVTDTVSGIIAGTFEFNAMSAAGETVRITDGRFDIKSPQ